MFNYETRSCPHNGRVSLILPALCVRYRFAYRVPWKPKKKRTRNKNTNTISYWRVNVRKDHIPFS